MLFLTNNSSIITTRIGNDHPGFDDYLGIIGSDIFRAISDWTFFTMNKGFMLRILLVTLFWGGLVYGCAPRQRIPISFPDDGRRMSGAEILKLLPGNRLTGWARNGEWIWELSDGGEGVQIWDSGARHYMTWSVRGNRLCTIFSAGNRADEERCRPVIDHGNGEYSLKGRRQLLEFTLKALKDS